jgi:predicted metal-dependent phosphoesterase TrpH
MRQKEDHQVRVELHCHTRVSHDSLVPVDRYLSRCKKLGISKIAITDHNEIKAAITAKSLAPEMVIVGEEIQTSRGELLGYFMTEWVPPGLDPKETIDRLRNQGAFICIPHPFDPFRSKDWEPGDLEALAPYVDAVETFNARCMGNKPNLEAAFFAIEHRLLMTVGSDAHTLDETGNATLIMPDFLDAESFKTGLKSAKQLTESAPFYTHIFSTYAKIIRKLKKL